jgi:hypothetical protein
MRCRVSVVTFEVLRALLPLCAQQHNCPAGFDYAGILKGGGAYGIPFNQVRELDLPSTATIDTSFQQANVRASAGNKEAKSDMRAKDIPKGILIIPSGSTLYDNGWAVSKPELKQVGSPARYHFSLNLYCISSSTPPTMHYGGCDVSVEVCFKPQK